MLHKVNGVWQEELTFVGDGFVILLGVDSFSPFALVADPSTLAIPDQPTVCTFQPKNAKVREGVLQAEVSATGVQTAIDLARKLAEQDGTAYNGVAVTIDLTGQTAAFDGCALTLTKDACKKLEQAGVSRLDVETGQCSLSLDGGALKAVYAAKGDVTLRADKAEGLSETVQTALGDRPAYQVSAAGGGKAVPIFSQGAVTLSLPYVPQGNEQGGSLTLAYVGGADAAALPLTGKDIVCIGV